MDTLAEWLRRRPAKPMGSPRVGSNPTGVALWRAIATAAAVRKMTRDAAAGKRSQGGSNSRP